MPPFLISFFSLFPCLNSCKCVCCVGGTVCGARWAARAVPVASLSDTSFPLIFFSLHRCFKCFFFSWLEVVHDRCKHKVAGTDEHRTVIAKCLASTCVASLHCPTLSQHSSFLRLFLCVQLGLCAVVVDALLLAPPLFFFSFLYINIYVWSYIFTYFIHRFFDAFLLYFFEVF